MATASQFSFIQQWMNLIGLLKYGIFFSALLIFLPLSAIKGVPLHGMLGGLFSGLSVWEILWASIAFVAAAWSVMFTEGLIVDGIEARWKRGGAVHRLSPQQQTGYVPGWAEEFFSVPVSRPQLVAFSFLALPGIFIIIWFADTSWPFRIIGTVIGIVVAYFIMVVLCAPARLADPTYRPLPDLPLAERIWSWLSFKPFKWFFRLLRRIVSYILWIFHMRYLLATTEEDREKKLLIVSDHFFAVTNVTGLVVSLGFVAGLLYPGNEWGLEPPAVGYLYILVTLLIWIFAALDFHLGRLRVSPLLVLLLIVVIGYRSHETDHYYRVFPKTVGTDRLTPVKVAKGSQRANNLVVVASAGGGILAAGWTTLALENLIASRPELSREIRLLSTISGGSVGAAYYIDGLLGAPSGSSQEARVKATTSSLAAAAYGLAFLDFWRLVSGGRLPRSEMDRGLLLEDEWARIAAGAVIDDTVHKIRGTIQGRSFLSLRTEIEKGRIPAPIFGATIMESGRRVMITPMQFDPMAKRSPSRAETLSEFLCKGTKDEDVCDGKNDVDMSLWTAARLSANFAYVSPAARAKFHNAAVEPKQQQRHHIIDGGYYDNFGVTSTLDWLAPVLDARLKGKEGLEFRRVLIIQLRAFRQENPKKQPAEEGSVAALLGPLVGLEKIRSGAALSRDEIDVTRLVGSWNAQFKENRLDVCIDTVVFEPPQGEEGPLSWHLTKDQKNAMVQAWYRKDRPMSPKDPTTWADEIRQQWEKMKNHLTGAKCDG